MKRREFLVGVGATLLNTGTTLSGVVAAEERSYSLGETPVTLKSYTRGNIGPTFFAPHSDETTSIEVAMAAVKRYGGRLFWLSHGDPNDPQRLITFMLDGKEYVIDPNRIFSNKGAKANLKLLGRWSPAAVREVRQLGRFILDQLFDGIARPLVGMHNNDNLNLSAKSYKSGDNQNEAAKVYINPKLDADDFFFVTRKIDFDTLKKKGFNVVLQAWPIPDDGSLSVYCRKSRLPYINIEAQDEHFSQQREMLEALYEI